MDGEIANPLDRDAAEIVESVRTARLEPGAERAVDGAKLDSEGMPFDPRVHTGTRSPKGRWRRRKNASLELLEGGAAAAGAPESVPALEQSPAADLDTLANLTVVSLTSTLACLFGSHWRADSEELVTMRAAWSAYFAARGVSDLPPEAFLLLAMAGYVTPRLAHPQTRSWLARAFDAVRRGMRRIFQRRRGELHRAAHVDHRADRYGEDPTSAEARAPLPASGNRPAGVVADPPRV